MKRAVLLLLLFAPRLFADDSLPSVPFATVRAYAWPDDQSMASSPKIQSQHVVPPHAPSLPLGPLTINVILPGMKLAPGVINKEGALLTPDQVHRLRVAASRQPPVARGIQKIPVFNCYDPHNAFVFYNAAKKPVAYLEVCFSCLGNTDRHQEFY